MSLTRLPRGSSPPLQPTVVLFGRVGDMVMVSALLHYLHARYHRPCLVLGAGGWNSAIFAGHPDVDRVWSFPRHAPFFISAAWWRALRSLHGSDPGPIYICERFPRQLARVRRLLALSAINPARCVFLTDEASSLAEQHWVDRFVRLGERTPRAVSAADYPLPAPPANQGPSLNLTDQERRERDEWLRSRGWSGRVLILVQPGNRRSMSRNQQRWRALNADDKVWPTACWVALLEKIHAQIPQALMLLCGAPQEGAMLREIAAAARIPSIIEAELPLRRLFSLCEIAHSMISVDTGPAHAAAALGLPLVVLFGAESRRCWLPRSRGGSPVLGVGGPPDSVRVDQLTVDEVFDAWRMLLAQMRGRAAAVASCEGS